MQSNVVLLFFSNNFESNISIVLVIQKKQNPLKKEKSFSLPEFLLVHIKKANKIWRKWKCSGRYYNDRYVSLCNCPNPLGMVTTQQILMCTMTWGECDVLMWVHQLQQTYQRRDVHHQEGYLLVGAGVHGESLYLPLNFAGNLKLL